VPKVPKSENKTRKAELPPVGRQVMVQCEGFRGLAYRDSKGIWKSVIGNKTLPEVMEFCPPQ
jgi:GH24 family phage-related lysozyme (muramidase)